MKNCSPPGLLVWSPEVDAVEGLCRCRGRACRCQPALKCFPAPLSDHLDGVVVHRAAEGGVERVGHLRVLRVVERRPVHRHGGDAATRFVTAPARWFRRPRSSRLTKLSPGSGMVSFPVRSRAQAVGSSRASSARLCFSGRRRVPRRRPRGSQTSGLPHLVDADPGCRLRSRNWVIGPAEVHHAPTA